MALLSCALWDSEAQNKIKMETKKESAAAISNVLESHYFKGIYEGDTALLNTVYYSGTLLFGDVKGQPYAKDLAQYLDGVAHRQSPKESGKPFKGEVLNIRVTNSIAVAEVRVTMYDFVYQEYLSFHKIDGKWLIVNKMISDVADQVSGGDGNGAKTTVIATMTILPGFEREVRAALNTMTIESNKEADCEQFAATFEKDAPQKVVVYEVYKSDAAFELHKTLPHAKAFFELVRGKIANDKIDAVYLTQIGSK